VHKKAFFTLCLILYLLVAILGNRLLSFLAMVVCRFACHYCHFWQWLKGRIFNIFLSFLPLSFALSLVRHFLFTIACKMHIFRCF